MTKKYFDTPSLVLVKMQSNDIVTASPSTHPTTGNLIPQSADRAAMPGRRTIWD